MLKLPVADVRTVACAGTKLRSVLGMRFVLRLVLRKWVVLELMSALKLGEGPELGLMCELVFRVAIQIN